MLPVPTQPCAIIVWVCNNIHAGANPSATIADAKSARLPRLPSCAQGFEAVRNCHVGERLHPRRYTSKPPPEVPIRIFLKSQLMAALRQRAQPMITADPDLALPFTRMLRARELRLRTVGGLVAEAMSYAISRYYGADIEAHWYIRPIRPSGQRAASYLKAEGTSGYVRWNMAPSGGFREVPSVDRKSACAAPSTAEWPCLLRSHPPPPNAVARLSTVGASGELSPVGDYARSDSANCSRADATLQLHASSSGCSDKTVVTFGSVIDPRRELCPELLPADSRVI